MLPQEVGVTSFRLFNLWLKAAGGRKRLGHDLLWVSVSDGGLTCFVMQEGRLVFARTGNSASNVSEGEEDFAGDLDDKHCRGMFRVPAFACRENHPGLNVTEVVFAGDSSFPTIEQALSRNSVVD